MVNHGDFTDSAYSVDQVRKLSTLVDVARELTSCRSTTDVINKVLGSAMEALETSDAGIFYLYDEPSGLLKVQTAVGFTHRVYQLQMKPGESMSGRAFMTGQAALYNQQTQISAVMGGQSRANLSAMTEATQGATYPKSALVAPMKLSGQPIGVLVLDNFTREDAFTLADLQLLQSLADQAAIAVDNVRLYEKQATLVQQLEQALFEVEVRGKRDLIDELLAGKASPNFERSARALGIDAEAPMVCLWLDIDRFSRYLNSRNIESEQSVQSLKRHIYAALNQIVRAESPQSFVSLKSDEFVVFLQLTSGNATQARARAQRMATTFQRWLAENYPGLTVSIGVSQIVHGLEAVIAALDDVRCMVDVQQRNGRHGLVFFTEDLGVDRLLLQFPNAQELLRFADGVLGVVVQGDKAGHNDLLNTLAVYLAQHRSISEAARLMHLHQNTVRYRLDRVKTLLGHEDWLSVELAMRVYQLHGRL